MVKCVNKGSTKKYFTHLKYITLIMKNKYIGSTKNYFTHLKSMFLNNFHLYCCSCFQKIPKNISHI